MAATRRPGPPATTSELLERARALAGSTLGEVAAALAEALPPDQTRAKGRVGELLERALGATAGTRDVPDFEALGVELKTLPVDRQGRPTESTFVCSIALGEIEHEEWETSRVRRKLAHVLWIPIEAERDVPLAARRIGGPLLSRLEGALEDELRADWMELAGAIGRGDVEGLTAHAGTYLQVRPKAASGRARGVGRDADGGPVSVNPRGFYLRPRFTERLLREAFGPR